MSSAVLAIEMSQRQGSIALRAAPDAEILTERVPPATDERDELMPAIAALVARAGLAPGDLAVVAVSIGPGGFTGLRVAVATAKALAFATGARTVGVPSALVVARAVGFAPGAREGMVGVALAAKGESAWFERIGLRAGVPATRIGALHTAADAPIAGLVALATDAFLPATWVERAAELGVPLVPAVWNAAACLQEGERLLAAGARTDAAHLTPVYPRPPEAVTLWEARKSAAEAGGAG